MITSVYSNNLWPNYLPNMQWCVLCITQIIELNWIFRCLPWIMFNFFLFYFVFVSFLPLMPFKTGNTYGCATCVHRLIHVGKLTTEHCCTVRPIRMCTVYYVRWMCKLGWWLLLFFFFWGERIRNDASFHSCCFGMFGLLVGSSFILVPRSCDQDYRYTFCCSNDWCIKLKAKFSKSFNSSTLFHHRYDPSPNEFFFTYSILHPKRCIVWQSMFSSIFFLLAFWSMHWNPNDNNNNNNNNCSKPMKIRPQKAPK